MTEQGEISTLSAPLRKRRAISSVGRALQSHCRGHWFEPSIAHHPVSKRADQRPARPRNECGRLSFLTYISNLIY